MFNTAQFNTIQFNAISFIGKLALLKPLGGFITKDKPRIANRMTIDDKPINISIQSS